MSFTMLIRLARRQVSNRNRTTDLRRDRSGPIPSKSGWYCRGQCGSEMECGAGRRGLVVDLYLGLRGGSDRRTDANATTYATLFSIRSRRTHPAGADLRWTPEWDRIKEARRADDAFDSGKWAKKERKVADWRLVHELATSMLTEAFQGSPTRHVADRSQHQAGRIPGLRDGLQFAAN